MQKVILFIRTVFSFFVIFFGSMTGAILCILGGIIDPYSKFNNTVIKIWASTILSASGVKVIVEGKENLTTDRFSIYAANHMSSFDIMAMVKAIPETARFIAKKELFKIPVFAQGMRASGMIEVDRGNSAAARASMDRAIKTIKDGCSVIIFPEGTRSKDGTIHPFKKGGFILAIKGGIPVIPTVIQGSQHVTPPGDKMIYPGTILIRFLPPIEAGSYSYDARNDMIRDVQQRVVAGFDPDYNRGDHYV